MNRTCKDCKDRHRGCQDITTCEVYRATVLRNQKIKASRARDKMFDEVERLSALRTLNAMKDRKSMRK